MRQEEQELAIAIGFLWTLFKYHQIFDPDTVHILIEIVKTDNHPVQKQSLATLINILMFYPNRAVQNELISLLYTDDEELRQTLVQLMGDMQDIQAIPHLALLLEDVNSVVVAVAQRALKNMQSPAAELALQEWQQRQ